MGVVRLGLGAIIGWAMIGQLQKLTNKIELDALFFAVILIVSVRTSGAGLDGE